MTINLKPCACGNGTPVIFGHKLGGYARCVKCSAHSKHIRDDMQHVIDDWNADIDIVFTEDDIHSGNVFIVAKGEYKLA